MKFTKQEIIFNGAFAFMFAGLLVYMVRDSFVIEKVQRCSQRYLSSTEFSLDHGTGPLSSAQLVGTIGATQRGVYNNAKVVRVRGVAGERALKVTLRREDGDSNGIRFQWSPRSLEKTNSACLSYSIYLPKKFEFAGGGFLPSLYTGMVSQNGEPTVEDGAITKRIVWRNDGSGTVIVQQRDDETKGKYLDANRFNLPTGRWVAIEHEMILNAPGERDGVARVWIDGKQVLSKDRVNWRKSDKLVIKGVQADVGYDNPRRAVKRPTKDTSVYISPMLLRWQ
jgi:hypothetical protein